MSEDESETWRASVIGLDETHHHLIQRLARWAERFIKRASFNNRTRGTWMVIGGPPGVGKTHCADRVHRWFQSYAVDLWYSGKWAVVPSVCKVDWALAVENDRPGFFEDVLRTIQESSIVILDDVGSETDRYKSQEAVGNLRQAINACDGKWLFMNTNIEKSRWDERFGARGADRMRAAKYLDLTGVPSYRTKLHKPPTQ